MEILKGVVQAESSSDYWKNSNIRFICVHASKAIFRGQAVVIGTMNIDKNLS